MLRKSPASSRCCCSTMRAVGRGSTRGASPSRCPSKIAYAGTVMRSSRPPLFSSALAAAKPGPFQIEAAISAVHCRARTPAETDWREIASLYVLLESFRSTPAVRVNRAFAVARADGPAAGLALLDRDGAVDVASYPYVHLVRGTLLEELGRVDEARRSLTLASNHARNAHERAQIHARIERLNATKRGSLA